MSCICLLLFNHRNSELAKEQTQILEHLMSASSGRKYNLLDLRGLESSQTHSFIFHLSVHMKYDIHVESLLEKSRVNLPELSKLLANLLPVIRTVFATA